MMKFEEKYDELSPKIIMEIPDQNIALPELLPMFESFLRASGYVFDGHLEFVQGEE